MNDNDKLAAILITSTCLRLAEKAGGGRAMSTGQGIGQRLDTVGDIAVHPEHCSLGWPAGTFIVRIFLLLVTAFQWLTKMKNKKKTTTTTTTTATLSNCLLLEAGDEQTAAGAAAAGIAATAAAASQQAATCHAVSKFFVPAEYACTYL